MQEGTLIEDQGSPSPDIFMFQNRVSISPNGEEMLTPDVIHTHDSLNNDSYTLPGQKRVLMWQQLPNTLVLTAQGKQVLRENTDLFERIQIVISSGQPFAEGREGKIFALPLADGNHIIKLVTPTSDIFKDFFTPGFVQMAMLAYIKNNNPIPGLQIVVPEMATAETTIAPRIEHARDLARMFYPQDLRQRILQMGNPDVITYLKDIFDYEEQHPERVFLDPFLEKAHGIATSLEDWINQKLQQQNILSPYITEEERIFITADEVYKNLMVSFPKLHTAFTLFASDPNLDFEQPNPTFEKAIAESLFLIEAIISSESLGDPSKAF